MPINTTAIVTYEVTSISIAGDGSCAVNVEVRLGARLIQSLLASVTAAEATPIWTGKAPADVARWTDLRDQLYALLQAKGVIPE